MGIYGYPINKRATITFKNKTLEGDLDFDNLILDQGFHKYDLLNIEQGSLSEVVV